MAIEDYIGKVYAVERHIKELREERERTGGTLTARGGAEDPPARIRSHPGGVQETGSISCCLACRPQSALGKALSYTTKQWPKLVRHLEHPDVPVDNNYLENRIRPVATERSLCTS